ncbi:hypothetical protein ASE75_12740 [Sphingomonas sp. Leaf17]|uniref:DUF3597 domain-containing protein n=1 Tax=Sphingomonas sp. Leaf17 TaxID=1735683 RepID=UPI0006FFC6DD|nr:DUF3597 domain-containing protein [Sphingomonas sp. Leaf17]KQM63324.1 hypothetical protein ASE75_12740 [Sphingomonas sp. Leaf17]
MSIFSKIKSAIFGDNGPLGGAFGGKKDEAPQPAPAAPVSRPTAAPQAAPVPTPAAAPAARQAPVDVDAILTARAQGKDLNWRSSIVDLMKLLDLDSSLTARKELADELGYTGAKDGSAEMNMWLHRAVMTKLAQNGGTVPADLRD